MESVDDVGGLNMGTVVFWIYIDVMGVNRQDIPVILWNTLSESHWIGLTSHLIRPFRELLPPSTYAGG